MSPEKKQRIKTYGVVATRGTTLISALGMFIKTIFFNDLQEVKTLLKKDSDRIDRVEIATDQLVVHQGNYELFSNNQFCRIFEEKSDKLLTQNKIK